MFYFCRLLKMCLQYMNQISFLSQVKHFKLQLFPNAFLYATAKKNAYFYTLVYLIKSGPGSFRP